MKIKVGKKIKIMMSNGSLGRVLGVLGMFFIIAGVTYGFLSLCYWSIDLQEWGGFGRFLLAAEGVIFLFKVLEEV